MKKNFLIYGGLMLSLYLGACTTKTSVSPGITTADRTFFMNAGSGGSFEIKTAKLALARDSSDTAIARFAHQMITDHTQLGNALKSTASQYGVMISDSLKGADSTNYTMLASAAGTQFVKSYVAMAVSSHMTALSIHQHEDSTTNNQQIRVTVENAIPVIRQHLTMAEMLNAIYNPK